jgi:hypothetical protein
MEGLGPCFTTFNGLLDWCGVEIKAILHRVAEELQEIYVPLIFFSLILLAKAPKQLLNPTRGGVAIG